MAMKRKQVDYSQVAPPTQVSALGPKITLFVNTHCTATRDREFSVVHHIVQSTIKTLVNRVEEYH